MNAFPRPAPRTGMRLLVLVFAVLGLAGCSASHSAVRHDAGAWAVRDYLKTAYQTLAIAETDTDGHRVRAQLETRAAIDALGELGGPARVVPYDGPPSLSVALELLEHSTPRLQGNPLAQAHAQRAVAELQAALR